MHILRGKVPLDTLATVKKKMKNKTNWLYLPGAEARLQQLHNSQL